MNMRRLIEAVKSRPVLYDPGQEDYTRHREKDLKWGEVAEEANLPNGAEAKSTWMKLRQSLRDALRRQQKCMRNGVEHFKLWKYQKQMEFLLPFMSPQLLEGSHFDMDDSEASSHNNYFLGAEDHEEKEGTTASGWNNDTKPTAVEMPTLPPEAVVGSNKRTTKDLGGSVPKRSRDDHQMMMRRTGGRSLQNDDGLYYFFMSMYETTRNMPQSSQLVVKNNIFRVVTSVEASLMNISTEPEANAVQWPTHEMSSDNE